MIIKNIPLPKDSNIIPLNIFQTWKNENLPINMKNTVLKLKKDNPEFNHYLFTDNMCRIFIQTYFDNYILYAFDKLKPGAYKADLWRYCVLYIYGGIYMDVKLQCINNFKLINLIDKEHFPKDRINLPSVWQGLLVCKPHNIILKKCIDQLCDNVNNNYLGISSLDITGPLLVANVINSINDEILDNYSIKLENNLDVTLNGIVIINEYKEYIDDLKNLKIRHYGDLWKKKQIYNHNMNYSEYIKNIHKEYSNEMNEKAEEEIENNEKNIKLYKDNILNVKKEQEKKKKKKKEEKKKGKKKKKKKKTKEKYKKRIRKR